jgi:F0F1-type ATP synthase assembly protein I
MPAGVKKSNKAENMITILLITIIFGLMVSILMGYLIDYSMGDDNEM